jgi:hypothetical protein
MVRPSPVHRRALRPATLKHMQSSLQHRAGDGGEDGRTWRLREVQSVLTTVTAMAKAVGTFLPSLCVVTTHSLSL